MAALSQPTVLPGFANPVTDAQYSFRGAMDALARPAHAIAFAPELHAPMSRGMAALALSLLDFEVKFWLAPSLRKDGEIANYLRFHTGSREVEAPSGSSFAFLDLTAGDVLDLSAFAQGTPDYPDRSTTVIARCADVQPIAGLHAEGPGIAGRRPFGFAPMPGDFLTLWSANRAGFPLGVDLLLVAEGALLGLPRSTRIVPGE